MSPRSADAAAALAAPARRASPSSFRTWISWQALLAVLPIVLVLAGLYARRAARPIDEISDLKPWRLWVRLRPGATPKMIDAIALRPGGAEQRMSAPAYPSALSDGTTTQTWENLQVSFADTSRLLHRAPVYAGSYTLVGPVVAAGGATWQEAWRGPVNQGVSIDDSDRSAAGTWEFVSETGMAGLRVLARGGTHDGPGGRERLWASRDGVLVVQWRELLPSAAKLNVRNLLPYGQFMMGTLSDDGSSFEGVDWLGRPVTGKKVE